MNYTTQRQIMDEAAQFYPLSECYPVRGGLRFRLEYANSIYHWDRVLKSYDEWIETVAQVDACMSIQRRREMKDTRPAFGAGRKAG